MKKPDRKLVVETMCKYAINYIDDINFAEASVM